MSDTTKIQWCDSTVNPVMGCSGCELWEPGCQRCYAGRLHQRRRTNPGFSPDFLTPKLFPGRMAKAARWADLTGTERADKPWLNRLPRVIFVSDMGDALSEHNAIDSSNKPLPGGAVPFEFLKAEIIDTALSEKGRRHRWLWLTKRPRRMAEFTDWLRQQHDMELPTNIWVGTTVTGREKLDRIPHLRRVGTARTTRFVSAEPLLEEITLSGHLDGVRWVIVGGESQQKEPAREFRCEWARRLRDECAAAGVALFVKQLGSRPTDGGVALSLVGGHGGDWNEWPSDLQIRQIA